MLTKTTITITASLVVLMLAMTASTFLATPTAAAAASSHQHSVVKTEQHVVTRNSNNNGDHDTITQNVNSLSVTQSGGNKPKVECEGNWLCETIGNTVIARLDDDDNTAIATGTTTALTQSSVQTDEDGLGSDDDHLSSINQDELATNLASTIIGSLINNHIMVHWSWLGI
jgi:hypothetical protein